MIHYEHVSYFLYVTARNTCGIKTEELVIREIRIDDGRMLRRFSFTDDEIQGHYALKLQSTMKSLL